MAAGCYPAAVVVVVMVEAEVRHEDSARGDSR